MLFKDVIGQDEVKEQLLQMVAGNRLSHALLFLGKEGAGALPLAMAFAQYVVSMTSQPTKIEAPALDMFGMPIAQETSSNNLEDSAAFKRAAQLIHPDLHFTFPVIPKKSGDKPTSKDYITEWREFIANTPYGNVYDWLQLIGAENKQGNITAEECNDIIHKLSLKSFESTYKILLLWMPEYLGKEGNKLLKLIEEPPPNTLFLLVAENEEQILPTIISRCQLVKVGSPSHNEIVTALIEKAYANPTIAHQIAGICDGNYRVALQLLVHAETDWLSFLKEWLNATLKGGPINQMKVVDDFVKLGREKQKQFLRYFNHLIEQSIRIKILNNQDAIQLPPEEAEFAARLNKISSVSQQKVMVEALDNAAYYIERNANGKMLFLALTIRLYHLIVHKKVFEL